MKREADADAGVKMKSETQQQQQPTKNKHKSSDSITSSRDVTNTDSKAALTEVSDWYITLQCVINESTLQ